MASCYLLLLAVDLLNGGGWSNLTATGINYLPLIALAPFAYALRSLHISPEIYDRALQATVLLALAISVSRLGLWGEERPGGPNLNPIPYGMVIAVWTVFLFSRWFATGRTPLLVLAGVALVPVFLTESKIAFLCVLLGSSVVAVLWAAQGRHWKLFWSGFTGAAIVAAGGYYLVAGIRVHQFINDVSVFLDKGALVDGSFGHRVGLLLAGWHAFLEKPLLGHGQAQYMEAVRSNALSGGPDISQLGHLHNDYVAHLASFGIFGALFLVAYLAFTLILVSRSGDAAYRCAGVALITMLVVYMTSEIAFNMDPITGCVTLAFGVILSAPATGAEAGTIHGKSTKRA